MDKLYKGQSRHDATRWGDNPADWMKPYNDVIFQTWAEWDVGAPGWDRAFKKYR